MNELCESFNTPIKAEQYKEITKEKYLKLECLQRHEGVPMRPTPRCSP